MQSKANQQLADAHFLKMSRSSIDTLILFNEHTTESLKHTDNSLPLFKKQPPLPRQVSY